MFVCIKCCDFRTKSEQSFQVLCVYMFRVNTQLGVGTSLVVYSPVHSLMLNNSNW